MKPMFDRSKCWYKDVCEHFNSDNLCNHACIRYLEMRFLMESSGIPEARQQPMYLSPEEEDLQAFRQLKTIKDDILEFVKLGSNLYIYSEKLGNGKTTWAIKLLQKYFDIVWCGNCFKIRGLFVNVPTFLSKLKFNIQDKDEAFDKFRKKLFDVDLVVWDDIAANKLTDYEHSILLTFIDQRKLNNLSNIYTGNLGEKELFEALGNRLSSRVWNDSFRIKFFGEDRRHSKW